MSDLVVTCPMNLWERWIAEGDAAGDPETGEEWGWFLGGREPPVKPGERLYIVAHGKLRGYAPVTRVVKTDKGWAICRKAGAVAVTILEPIKGFRGYRFTWWAKEREVAFPRWKEKDAPFPHPLLDPPWSLEPGEEPSRANGGER